MSRLDDLRLTESLEQLPRHQASQGFADKVMVRLQDRSARGFLGTSAFRWAIATALALAIGMGIGTTVRDHQRQQLAYKQKIDSIRSQYHQIQTDVESLRREAANSPTVVYLGGNESFDLVLDLADLATYRSATRPAVARPANYQPVVQ